YKLGLSWEFSQDKMAYALYSQGFRLGGRNNPKAVRVNFVEETYDPDKLHNYEVGIKSEWFDNRLVVNADVFYLVWEDIQLVLGSGQSGLWWLSGQANGGGGENIGVELDFDWWATENLRLSGSYYHGDAQYTDDYVTLEGLLEMSAGTQMPNSANDKFSIAADYTFRDVLGGDIWLRADAYHVGPLFSALWRADYANPASPNYEPGSTYDVDGFSKYNFQAGYERENWAVSLFVKNLTNERANTYTTQGTGYYGEYWGNAAFGEEQTLARPRTISLRFTYRL
ncbi:MAG: TonB-dependent receptor, partial [Proteobacteria bacterium]|nr:TonB-dependent receptor [Pseudomonadota bacterium]